MLRPVARAAGVVALAGLVCSAVLRAVALQVRTHAASRDHRRPTRLPAPPTAKAHFDTTPLVTRNIFYSRCARDDPSEPNPCAETAAEVELDLVVYGTTAANDPAWSSALIAPRRGAQAAVGHAVGDSVLPGVVLATVEPGRVELSLEGGQRTWLSLLEPGQGRELRRAASAGGKAVTRRRGDGTYEVSDAPLAKLYEDPAAATRARGAIGGRPRRGLGRVEQHPDGRRGVPASWREALAVGGGVVRRASRPAGSRPGRTGRGGNPGGTVALGAMNRAAPLLVRGHVFGARPRFWCAATFLVRGHVPGVPPRFAGPRRLRHRPG